MSEDTNRNDSSKSSEQRVLEAAIKEFTAKGYTGARMQSIADKAEISKSALHYYFRDKERLFRKVLDETVGKTITRLKFVLNNSGSFEDKLRRGISEYYQSITKNISIVKFLLFEFNRNPEIVNRFLAGRSYFSWISELESELEKEHKSGRINKVTAEELILNLISLCVFPQLAAPLAGRVLQKTEQEYKELLSVREEHIIEAFTSLIIKRQDKEGK